MTSFLLHRKLIVCLVVVVHIATLVFFVAAAHLPLFDSSPSLVLKSAHQTSLLRWDAFHFAHLARDGYVFEYEYAFFPGTPLVMRYGAKLLHAHGNLASVLTAGALASAAVAVDAALTLYDLTLHYFQSPATALLATLLSLLSSSPATLRYAPNAEPFFVYLSYKGMLFCARRQFLRASAAFTLASIFRSNGIMLVGYIVWGMLIEPEFLRPSAPRKPFSAATMLMILHCVLLSALPLLPFLWYQYDGYVAFCTASLGENRPWCSNRLPLIYSFVQSAYWDVGPFRYWTLQQAPNILLAAPVVVLLYHASILHVLLGFIPRVLSNFSREKSVGDEERGPISSDPFLAPSLTPHALHAFVFSSVLLVSAHTQIVLRLASALPFTYWAAARLFIGKPESSNREMITNSSTGKTLLRKDKSAADRRVLGRAARWWVDWSVLWGAISLVTWAVFLPPA